MTIPAVATAAAAGATSRPDTLVLQADRPALVLASASNARRRLLHGAGLTFTMAPANLDEAAVKREAKILDASAEATALRLARLKAQSASQPDTIVLGCDQILVCDGLWYDKPPSLEVARTHLRALRGRTHTLATATVALRGGVEVWKHTTSPRLRMRGFTEAFLEAYLAAEGDALLSSVGAYRLEGLGAQLFDAIEGEHSAILGLPLLPVLGFLRAAGVLNA
jgi:septum formation protein